MADTNTNGNGWRTFGIIVSILAGIYFLIGVIKGEFNPRKWFAPATPPSPDKTDFEQCKEANRSKPDNEPCSNCIAEGSGQPVFNGVIRNGECVRVATSATINLRKIKVKANGAKPYSVVSGNFVSLANAATIPFGTELTVLQITNASGTNYFNTAMGWISANDVDVMM